MVLVPRQLRLFSQLESKRKTKFYNTHTDSPNPDPSIVVPHLSAQCEQIRMVGTGQVVGAGSIFSVHGGVLAKCHAATPTNETNIVRNYSCI